MITATLDPVSYVAGDCDCDADGIADAVDPDTMPKPGTPEAKVLAESTAKLALSDKAVEQGKLLCEAQGKEPSQCYGIYAGKPLVKGVHPGDGDFEFLQQQCYLRGEPGMTWEVAGKVAAKVKAKLYGGV